MDLIVIQEELMDQVPRDEGKRPKGVVSKDQGMVQGKCELGAEEPRLGEERLFVG